MTKITIYSTPTCSYCQAAKAFFKENKLEYQEIDVANDTKAAEEMTSKTGQMGVPVIIIKKDDKEDVVIGFDVARLSQLLEIS